MDDAVRLDPARLMAMTADRAVAARAWADLFHTQFDAGEAAVRRLHRGVPITVETADKWCMALGDHLSVIYPDLYGHHSQPP